MGDCYLHIKNLVVDFKTYGKKTEVLNIDELKINRGEAYGIVGESGTGKTVLALSILRLLQMPPGEIRSGEIWLDGEDILKASMADIRRRIRGKRISMIFQDPMSTLNPVFTVKQQMMNVIRANQHLKGRQAEAEAINMLHRVKLPDPEQIIRKYPHELSGGQRQRVTIALALSCKSEFIIADEPTRNLDVTIQAGILKLIKQLQRELRVTVLFIANNPGLIYSTCDNAAVLYHGMILEKGTVDEVLKDPRHPYTHMLLNAIPKEKHEKIDLSRLAAEREGIQSAQCRFYHRCLNKQACCMEAQGLQDIGGTHKVRCQMFKAGGQHD